MSENLNFWYFGSIHNKVNQALRSGSLGRVWDAFFLAPPQTCVYLGQQIHKLKFPADWLRELAGWIAAPPLVASQVGKCSYAFSSSQVSHMSNREYCRFTRLHFKAKLNTACTNSHFLTYMFLFNPVNPQINFEFLPQPHQKCFITQYEERGFS